MQVLYRRHVTNSGDFHGVKAHSGGVNVIINSNQSLKRGFQDCPLNRNMYVWARFLYYSGSIIIIYSFFGFIAETTRRGCRFLADLVK